MEFSFIFMRLLFSSNNLFTLAFHSVRDGRPEIDILPITLPFAPTSICAEDPV
jgi:hypothetical protein